MQLEIGHVHFKNTRLRGFSAYRTPLYSAHAKVKLCNPGPSSSKGHTVHRIAAWFVLLHVTLGHCIVIYPVNSIIQPLNNWSLDNKQVTVTKADGLGFEKSYLHQLLDS